MESQLRQLMEWNEETWKSFLCLGKESMNNSIYGLHEIGVADDSYSRGLFLSETASEDVIAFALRPRTPYVSKQTHVVISDEDVSLMHFLSSQGVEMNGVAYVEVRRLFVEGRNVFMEVRCVGKDSSVGSNRFHIDYSSKDPTQVKRDREQYQQWYENELHWHLQYQEKEGKEETV